MNYDKNKPITFTLKQDPSWSWNLTLTVVVPIDYEKVEGELSDMVEYKEAREELKKFSLSKK